MDSTTERADQQHMRGWRVHLCTTTPDQVTDETAAREWFHQRGCTVLVPSSDRIESKIEAARQCDLCILLLGSSFGPCDPLSSFSHAELEVSAAADVHPDKILIFRRSDAAESTSPEQREFSRRVGNFPRGSVQNAYHTPEELTTALDKALASWYPPQPGTLRPPLAVPFGAIMISSTSDLKHERALAREVIENWKPQGLPVIDYLKEPSESVRPLDRVLSWAQECHALVLILNENYGSLSQLDGLGITELEFMTALRAERPILALIGPKANQYVDKELPRDPDQRQFVERVLTFVPSEYIRYYDEATFERELRNGLAHLLQARRVENLTEAPEADRQRWYRRQVQRWLGTVPHLVQRKGMPLDQIYVSLALAPLSSSATAGEEHDEEAKVITLEADEALKRFPRMVLAGEPGTGKTVALRWFAVSAEPSVIPIYIRLGAYAQALERQSVSSLEDYIRQEERRLLLTTSDGQGLWLSLLQSGRGVILLDGLDEVSDRRLDATSTSNAEATGSLRYQVTRDILRLAQQLPATPIVVATRSVDGAADQLMPLFTALRIQPLNSTQQRQVVLQWLHTAHPQHPLVSVQTAQRVFDALGSQERLRTWAATPLMLMLLTTLIDAVEGESAVESLSRAALLRRAIRLLLGQWGTLATRDDDDQLGKRRLGGKHLWAKEQLLVRLAWNALVSGRRQIISGDDVATAWQTLPQLAHTMADESSLVSELSSEDGLLPQVAEGQYVFYHPIFQEYLSAVKLAVPQPSDERLDVIARKRLDATWDETTQLLADELDRLGRPDAADEVVRILIDADRLPLTGLAWPDPTHLALRRAARVQGNRTKNVRQNATGAALAEAWRDILQRRLHSREDYGIVWTWAPPLLNACQAFLDMGEAAATAAPLFSNIAHEVIRQASGNDLFDRTPGPLVPLIEALGSRGESGDVDLLARLLERDQGIGEPQAAALRGLLQLGPAEVRPYRHLLPRFVYAGSSALRLRECGELAAALLIHLDPTKEELEGIERLGGRWRQEALWAASLLPLSDAIEVLHKTLVDGSGHIRGFYGERSRLDFRDDTMNDDRFAALAASGRLGPNLLPLLSDVLFRTTNDTPRNRRLAENIVLELGVAAVPGMRAYIADRCRNDYWREVYFGPALTELETASNPEKIRSLLAQSIAALRQIAEIQDQQWQDYLSKERAAGRTPSPQEVLRSVSLDQLLMNLRSARTNRDPLVQEVLIAQVLDTIAHMGPSAAPALEDVRLLANEPRFRRRAMAALAGLGSASASALPELVQALSDQDELTRAHAIEAIGQLGEAARPALPLLRSFLSPRSNAKIGDEVRLQAVIAWGRLWPMSRPFLPDVLEIVQKGPDTAVGITGIDTLGQVADAEPQVLETLHVLAEPAGPHSRWDADLQGHARVALERVLERAEDAGSLPNQRSNTVGT